MTGKERWKHDSRISFDDQSTLFRRSCVERAVCLELNLEDPGRGDAAECSVSDFGRLEQLFGLLRRSAGEDAEHRSAGGTGGSIRSRLLQSGSVLAVAKRTLRQELANALSDIGVFKAVVASTNDIPAGAKLLTVKNEIYHHEKGGGGARYWAGLYGAGQPVIKVTGQMTAQEAPQFRYMIERSGESAGSRFVGAFLADEDIQTQDIKDLARDLARFVNQTARKLPRK